MNVAACSLCRRCDPSCGLVDVSFFGHPAFGLVCRDPASCADAYVDGLEGDLASAVVMADFIDLVLDQREAVYAAERLLAQARRE